jgi:hypothetical protein
MAAGRPKLPCQATCRCRHAGQPPEPNRGDSDCLELPPALAKPGPVEPKRDGPERHGGKADDQTPGSERPKEWTRQAIRRTAGSRVLPRPWGEQQREGRDRRQESEMQPPSTSGSERHHRGGPSRCGVPHGVDEPIRDGQGCTG